MISCPLCCASDQECIIPMKENKEYDVPANAFLYQCYKCFLGSTYEGDELLNWGTFSSSGGGRENDPAAWVSGNAKENFVEIGIPPFDYSKDEEGEVFERRQYSLPTTELMESLARWDAKSRATMKCSLCDQLVSGKRIVHSESFKAHCKECSIFYEFDLASGIRRWSHITGLSIGEFGVEATKDDGIHIYQVSPSSLRRRKEVGPDAFIHRLDFGPPSKDVFDVLKQYQLLR